MSPDHKPLVWMGDSLKRLRTFPAPVMDTMGFALRYAQVGKKHPDAKPLKGFGGTGVLEVVEDHSGDTYRAVYTVRFAGVVYVLHSFHKKSKKGIATPKTDIDVIKRRYSEAGKRHQAWVDNKRNEP
ncbi:type II toxin-antitoxin system RelE/ParE family toxin [Magnetococcales bacterium HHB-1]